MSDDERSRFLDILERDSKRLAQLVRRLLELARADVMPAAHGTADVGAVLQTVAARAPRAAEVVAPPALHAAIEADTLESVLGSLLDNVRAHGGDGAKVRLGAAAAAGDVVIDVQDDGAGISIANRVHVFEPFFTTARASGGTGLGLSIARALTRAHGGDLELLPSERGAHFRLRVPAVAR